MNVVWKDEDIIKGKIDVSRIVEKYGFIKFGIGMRGFDIENALAALNIMANNGWKYETFLASGKDAGFIVSKI